MAKKKDNTMMLVAVGAAVAVGLYFYEKNKKEQSGGASPAPGGQQLGQQQQQQQSAALGLASDQTSTAWACNAAAKLFHVGHPTEAAYWVNKCAAGGGQVPPNVQSLYG